MKKAIVVVAAFLAILLAFPIVLADTNSATCKQQADLDKERLVVRYDFAFYRIERQRIQMEAVIAGFGKKVDVSTLADTKNTFVADAGDLKVAALAGDVTKFEFILQNMKELANTFREDAKAANAGSNNAVTITVETDLLENRDYVDGLLKTAYGSYARFLGDKFDMRICTAQAILDRLSAKGIDVSKAQAQLDATKTKRANLLNLVGMERDSCSEVSLGACRSSDTLRYKEAVKDVEVDFKQIKALTRIELSDATISKLKDNIEKQKAKKVSTKGLENALSSVEKSRNETQSRYDKKDYEESSNATQGGSE